MTEPTEKIYPVRVYRKRRKKWLWIPLLLLLLVFAAGWIAWQGFRLPLSADERERVMSAEQTLGTEPIEVWGRQSGKTILLIGADRREGTGEQWGRSDTIIVARLLPSEKIVSLLSLPRDLQVEIPGYGFDKINAAYSYGGPRLLIETVRDWTGSSIDHFIEIDFEGFGRMVQEVGGVYLPIDQRYYNDNEGLSESYEEIDIEPGYQKLGAEDALAFVRYRHTDSDILRASRQQIFLRELSRQLELRSGDTGSLLGLARAFSEATTSDIRSPEEMLEIGNSVRGIGSDRIVRTTPEAEDLMSGGVYYLVAPPEQREAALERWNNPSLLLEGSPARRPTALGRDFLRATSWLVRRSRSRPFVFPAINKSAPLSQITLTLQRWRPLYWSTNASFAEIRQELFDGLRGGGGTRRDSLRSQPEAELLLSPAPSPPPSALRPCQPQSLPSGYSWGEHRAYRLEGKEAISLGASAPANSGILWNWSAWAGAPVLQNPDRVIIRDGRKLFLFWDSGRLRVVAWRSGRGYGWVTNTIQSSLDSATMLRLASDCR